MSYRSHNVAPTRVFDHLYDPIFTTSDPKNIYKENCIALTRSAPIRVYPVYNSMFSELCYQERNCYAYQKNPLPLTLPCINYQNKKPISVTGADRSKFFCNPISNTRTINVGLMADKNLEYEENTHKKFRNTSIQTLYRESSAQTKSWLPECFSKEFTVDVPELVYVADIIESVSYPGLKEVEIIERARKRREWEMTLPPIKTVDEIPKRVAALEAFEWEEWIAREKDINECQQARLKIIAELIEKRDIKHKTNTDLKIDNCKKRVLNERNHQKDLLINNFQRCMRKIDLAKRKELLQNLKDDPVLVHYDKKSDYSIPKIKIGTIKSKKRVQIEYNNEFKNRFASLEQEGLVEDIQRYLKPNREELWAPKRPLKEIERGMWNESYLKRLHETLKHFRRKKNAQRKYMVKKSSIENEGILTSLPIQEPDNCVDRNYQNSVLIQKTIKGRAVQSMLQKGMKKVQDIIQEAKETHSIAAVRKLFPKEFSQQIDCQEQIINEYRKIEELLKNDSKLQKELKKIELKGEGNLLNFFGKELNRLESEKQAHALYLLAERERYRREAEKLGDMSCEKQFKDDSVTLYLENILLEGINRAFDENSRSIIREMAQKIDNRADKIVTFDENVEEISNKSFSENEQLEEEICGKSSYRHIVTELFKDNMIPQIMNEVKNNKLSSQQKQYLIDAHQFLYKEEFEYIKLEEERSLCFAIFNEILENAISKSYELSMEKESLSRQESANAELLATQIVEEILNDIIENELEGTLGKLCINQKSVSDSESTDDLLAEIVTQDILNDVIEYKTSSPSELSETGESQY